MEIIINTETDIIQIPEGTTRADLDKAIAMLGSFVTDVPSIVEVIPEKVEAWDDFVELYNQS